MPCTFTDRIGHSVAGILLRANGFGFTGTEQRHLVAIRISQITDIEIRAISFAKTGCSLVDSAVRQSLSMQASHFLVCRCAESNHGAVANRRVNRPGNSEGSLV